MLTTGAPPNILIRANIYNNDPIRYIVLVVSCFVLPIPNIYRDTSVLIPSLSYFGISQRLLRKNSQFSSEALTGCIEPPYR